MLDEFDNYDLEFETILAKWDQFFQDNFEFLDRIIEQMLKEEKATAVPALFEMTKNSKFMQLKNKLEQRSPFPVEVEAAIEKSIAETENMTELNF